MFINQVRTRLNSARVGWQRTIAAPDRWKRKAWANKYLESLGINRTAESPTSLLNEGFSYFQVEPALLSTLLDEWEMLKECYRQSANREPRSTGKPFFEEMLSQEYLYQRRAFLDVALGESVLLTVMEAMGMLPHLESVDILCSQPHNGPLLASQLWHYDVNDERIIKLFIYLENCGPLNGPLTYIPATHSQRISGVVGHYVHDDEIARHVPTSEWKNVEGNAGAAFLIDTGRCYHFGSRCEVPRVAYIATYSTGIKYMRRARNWGKVLGKSSETMSILQRAVCDLTR